MSSAFVRYDAAVRQTRKTNGPFILQDQARRLDATGLTGRSCFFLGLLIGSAALTFFAPTSAIAGAKLDLPRQGLTRTLNEIARAEDAELVFDRNLTDTKTAPPVRGRFEIDDAMARALAGTGLVFSRNRDGVFIITLGAPHPAVDEGDGAVSELMVVGRRNLNTGIRRSRDDIQPYRVADEALLDRSASDTVESFLSERLPVNAAAGNFAQAPSANAATSRSRIDLLGLGSNQTLVLVDGRRMPSQPSTIGIGAGFAQGDLNAIPLEAVERVEVLTAAAGAIYGPGATGGVVNLVLKRADGNQASVSQGVSERGDGLRSRINLRMGGVSEDGRGQISLDLGLSSDRGLAVGQRDYGQRAQERSGQAMTSIYDIPISSGINVYSLTGPLTLKAAYGGAALGSERTYLSAAGFSAADAIANAGAFDTALATDAYGVRQSLLTATKARSVILSGRQRLGPAEFFIDLLDLENAGKATVPGGDAVFGPLAPYSPASPFQQTVLITRSVDWDGTTDNRLTTRRANAGVILRMPRRWSAEADYSYGISDLRVLSTARDVTIDALYSLLIGGGVFGPDYSPLADPTTFDTAYQAYRRQGGYLLKLRDRLSDFNLRASGPLAALPGGDLTMTILAEARLERAPGGSRWGYSNFTGEPEVQDGNWLTEKTRSGYVEIRAPLVSMTSSAPWRGLEFQLAMRADHYRLTVPRVAEGTGNGSTVDSITVGRAILGKTVGFRVFPLDGLMVRGSFADGYLPPTSDQVQPRVYRWQGLYLFASDPKRGRTPLGTDSDFDVVTQGSPEMRPERAQTFSVGVVVSPSVLPGLRMSLDYLRTDKSREITQFAVVDLQYFLDRESLYPDRVTRAALTAADIAKGYTVGAVTVVDASAINIGRSVAESVDANLDYRRQLDDGSTLDFRVDYIWQPSYRRRPDPSGPWYEYAGKHDGPVRHRLVAGAQWSKRRVSLATNARYVGDYGVGIADAASGVGDAARIADQGAETIRAQVYVDLQADFDLGVSRATRLRVSVSNIFDKQPPIDVAAVMGYSPYGDPRGRRIDLSVLRRF
jgi:outer membrane receptor protein involved in Fe transport